MNVSSEQFEIDQAAGKSDTFEPTNEPSNICEAALWYGSRNLKIFPCGPDKKPLVKWSESMSTDSEQIISWWREYPTAMIGLPCGSVNGLVVLDIDIKCDANGFESLQAAGHKIPHDTFAVRTPSGGAHYYFKLRPGEEIRNSAGKIARAVDVRGNGGYVIAPPSRNRLGTYALGKSSSWDQLEELIR